MTAPDVLTSPQRRSRPSWTTRPLALLKAVPDIGTYAGITLILVGFVLLAICWGKVAGLTRVGLQLPFLASAGFTGLGLIVVGIALVSVASRRRDAALRRAQMTELASTLRALRLLFDEPSERDLPASAKKTAVSALEAAAQLPSRPVRVRATSRSPKAAQRVDR